MCSVAIYRDISDSSLNSGDSSMPILPMTNCAGPHSEMPVSQTERPESVTQDLCSRHQSEGLYAEWGCNPDARGPSPSSPRARCTPQTLPCPSALASAITFVTKNLYGRKEVD